ncbi:MAG: glycosyltransferase [Balneolaceae bacterium]
MFYSVIVPVYNRPEEVDELLESLCAQTCDQFEVLIIEDGSERNAESVTESYRNRLNIRYYKKENTGQGFSRNFGFDRARGDYFVVFDSDCLVPEHYFQHVTEQLKQRPVDAWGGPDRAHTSFSPLQKAISYVMTSPLTTGGIRGGKKHLDRFYPRSFNMGISKEVYQKTGGYRITRMGEDIEFSIRIIEQGFKVELFPEAFVWHKRRTTLRQFYRQLHFFGRARINIQRFHPGECKWVHWLPSLFLLWLVSIPLLMLKLPGLSALLLTATILYFAALFVHAIWSGESLKTSLLVPIAAFTQLAAYGTGFIRERFFTRKHRENA